MAYEALSTSIRWIRTHSCWLGCPCTPEPVLAVSYAACNAWLRVGTLHSSGGAVSPCLCVSVSLWCASDKRPSGVSLDERFPGLKVVRKCHEPWFTGTSARLTPAEQLRGRRQSQATCLPSWQEAKYRHGMECLEDPKDQCMIHGQPQCISALQLVYIKACGARKSI